MNKNHTKILKKKCVSFDFWLSKRLSKQT